jgi:hypothetical protein
MKPLLRWTFGPCRPEGYEILELAINLAQRRFQDRFDWLICYNGLNADELKNLQEISERTKVPLYEQKWSDCAIPVQMGTARDGGKFRITGSLWKLCPARVRLESHEIIVDNDLIIFDSFPELEKFLSSSDISLMNTDLRRWLGRYEKTIRRDVCPNAGIIGLPPGFDFAKQVFYTWKKYDGSQFFQNNDEQGLVSQTLIDNTTCIFVPRMTIPTLHSEKIESEVIQGTESGLHYVTANRIKHQRWNERQADFANIPTLQGYCTGMLL